MSLADNLKELREQRQLTQFEVAKLVGVSQPIIAQYEQGLKVPSIVTGVKLAKLYRTTCERLVK